MGIGITAAIIIGGSMLLGAGASMYTSNKAAGTAEDANLLAQKNMDAQRDIAKEQLAFQKSQQKKLDKQKAIYSNFEFTNPYKDVENVYEDLTVNQQQAQFEQQMFQQSQANIMQNLKGAAGGSGVAGLAQALASQGQLASQRAGISIGQQEQTNQMAAGSAAVGAMSSQSAAQYGMAGTYMQAGMDVAGAGLSAYGSVNAGNPNSALYQT